MQQKFSNNNNNNFSNENSLTFSISVFTHLHDSIYCLNYVSIRKIRIISFKLYQNNTKLNN